MSDTNRLKNGRGEYPWQTVRWGFGIAYMALLPAAVLAEDGVEQAIGGFALGFAFLCFMAIVAWWWEI